MLWFFVEDEKQRKQNQFHGWMNLLYDFETVEAELRELRERNLTALEQMQRSVPEGGVPQSLVIKGGLLPDICLFERNSFVASARMREVMALPSTAHQVLPLNVFSELPEAADKDYRLVRILVGAPCLDKTLSEWSESHFTGETGEVKTSINVQKFVLDTSIAPPADLLFAHEGMMPLVATEALAKRIQDAGLTGVTFESAEYFDDLFGRPTHMRGPDGKIVPIDVPPFGPRPMRAPEARPAYVPDPTLPERLRPIEAAVRHRLPTAYVKFLQAPPDFMQRLSADSIYRSLTDPQSIAALNLRMREPFPDGDPSEWLTGYSCWPDDWLVICEDGAGNYWFIDLGAKPSPIMFYDHDYGEAQIVTSFFEKFASDLVAEDLIDG